MTYFDKSRLQISQLNLSLIFCLGLIFATIPMVACAQSSGNWYKGNTHCHSFWSDGNDFPEMVANWYKSHGYQFLAMSDHNILMRGEKWYPVRKIKKTAMKKCRDRFGDNWLEIKGQGKKSMVRLKTLAEIRKELEQPENFLMIENEEVTGKRVHVNAINIRELIMPHRGKNISEVLHHNIENIKKQEKRTGQTILAHVNHPNWKGYAVPPECVATTKDNRFVEICNNSRGINNLGDDKHPGMEKYWDIVNVIRLAQLKIPPVFGIASDDAHHHHRTSPKKLNPGRAWIVVRAAELSTSAIVDAISCGDFYASNGVVIDKLDYDPKKGTLHVAAVVQPGVKYKIEFVGTLIDELTTLDLEPAPRKEGRQYPPEIGKVLLTVDGPSATYRLTGKELYVRAVVRTDRRMPDPPAESFDMETAWTQPVGWEKWIKK